MREIRVGCCGWPESRARYFEHFDAVELQDTFYEPPSVTLAAKWRREAPTGFQFCMKAWQVITHPASSPTYRRLKSPIQRAGCGSFQETEQVRTAWTRTLEIARAVEAAVIVFQCPASFRPTADNIANLRRFFGDIEREGRRLAWEPRGAWPEQTVRRICEELDLIHCVDPLQAKPVHGRATYFRLHGLGGYRHRYTDEELAQLKDLVVRMPLPAWVMFNNVYMKDDALRFQALLSAANRSA